MSERPILFSGEMVRAILEGRKSQTRRVIKPQPSTSLCEFKGVAHNVRGALWRSGLPTIDLCPYGVPGDRLWVRETFYPAFAPTDHDSGCVYRADYGHRIDLAPTWNPPGGWKPSIFMPRSASRITLEITKVRVERIQDCSEADAKAEGAGISLPDHPGWDGDPDCYRKLFRERWDALNKKRWFGWQQNPWVWAIEFKRLSGAIG